MSSRRRKQGQAAVARAAAVAQAKHKTQEDGEESKAEEFVFQANSEDAKLDPRAGAKQPTKREKRLRKRSALLNRLQQQQQSDQAQAQAHPVFPGHDDLNIKRRVRRAVNPMLNERAAHAAASDHADYGGLNEFTANLLDELVEVEDKPSPQELRLAAEMRRMREGTRKRTRVGDLRTFTAVVAHPEFQRSPIEALQEHLIRQATAIYDEAQPAEKFEQRKRLKRQR